MSCNYRCILLWKTNENKWMENNTWSNLIVTNQTITIRNSETSSIMADFNNGSIRLEVASGNLIKVVTNLNEVCLAFKLLEVSMVDFKKQLESLHIQFIDHELYLNQNTIPADESNLIPNLQDEATQSLILKLLFNDSFHQFVDDLENMLSDFSDVINSQSK